MGSRLATILLAAGTIGAAGPLAGQAVRRHVPVPDPLAVIARSDLSFGTVVSGIPVSVDVHDTRRAGMFEVQGPAEASVRVELVLPAVLESAAGAELPVRFGAGDGFADFSRGRPPRGHAFDPGTALVASLGPNGRLYVRLGGTVLPARPQPGGAYRATIYVTVYDLGS